ncbi:hypothetical protein H0H87_006335 [Tephrocybe sp. NHM501043]|nr:hypothetical protein H0H87_006335 [Tephrocybe sp. NHM501043]
MVTPFDSPYLPYDPTDKSGFSYQTVIKRWPIILTGVVDQVHRDCHVLSLESQKEGAGESILDAKIIEGKTIIETISKLKYQMGRDHALESIPDDGEAHVEVYNKELDRLASLGQNTWFTAPWLFAECYLYRLLRSYCATTTHWKDYDPFFSQKMHTFSQSGSSIRKIATSMHELDSEKNVLDKEKLPILFREMLQMCLWGNATDLSLLTHVSADDIEHLQSVGKDAQIARQAFILKDNQDQLWKHLSSLEAGRVDFVLDNSGFELFTDFVFADFLVTYTPFVSKVYFHPKLIPWFVSDVTPPDFDATITSLLDPGFFPFSGDDNSALSPEHLTELVTRWKGYIELGVFNLSVPKDTPLGGNAQPAEFWTSPWPYWNMEMHAPELLATLKKSNLVIFKGDLNYRKLVGDVQWPAWTPFETAVGEGFPIDLIIEAVDHEVSLSLTAFQAHATVREPSNKRLPTTSKSGRHVEVLILGGGVTGVIAARTFHEKGINDFLILEARNEIGGRLRSKTFAGKTIELGANWIQGAQPADGPANPILTLARKHKLKTQFNDIYGTTYDHTGAVDYLDVFDKSVDEFVNHTIYSGERLTQNLVDLSSRSAYDLIGAKPQSAHARAAEYFNNNNFTYRDFSDENFMSIDQRGFKAFIQEEAKEFLKPGQLLLNSTVKTVSWSSSGIKAGLKDGSFISADYALCTFSLGVLQNDDVQFVPRLPAYKAEAIESMKMATYTKIFLKFPKKFWFGTEVIAQLALYADPERGRYPVWQSLDHKLFLPGSSIVFVTVTGDYSERIEALSDSQVKSEVLSVLQSMYPNLTIPAPSDFYFPRWHSDPLYRGSYSNWPPSFVKQHHDNLRSNVDRLYFAGEATSVKFFGELRFLHGAYFEGLDVAKSISECIKQQGCVGFKHFNETKNAIPYGIDISP